MAQLVERHTKKRKVASLIPIRAHAWAAGPVPGRGVCERQLTDVSLMQQCFPPLSLPSPSLKINKVKSKKKSFKIKDNLNLQKAQIASVCGTVNACSPNISVQPAPTSRNGYC